MTYIISYLSEDLWAALQACPTLAQTSSYATDCKGLQVQCKPPLVSG